MNDEEEGKREETRWRLDITRALHALPPSLRVVVVAQCTCRTLGFRRPLIYLFIARPPVADPGAVAVAQVRGLATSSSV